MKAMLKIGLLALFVASEVPAKAEPEATVEMGVLASGASWQASVPANWNGTLLLWSHGYQPVLRPAEDAPLALREVLLAAGYALAGSSFAKGGWALAEAVPDQLDTLSAFRARHGQPKRVIAWGNSMGGLVSTALAERPAAPVDGALAMCASIGGAVGMMNMALDGGYAFKTLIAPESAIRLVDVDDDRLNADRVAQALNAANAAPAGRARVALAAVLGGIPGWTSSDLPEPLAGDAGGRQAEMARAFVQGVMLPRSDQEARAGGNFSWNIGVDYRRQLALSGRRPLLAALYRSAGISLDRDLARLNAGPRIKAATAPVAYMLRNYTPNGRPLVPLLSVQKIGDGATSPSLQRGYADAVAANRRAAMLGTLWVRAAGHCNFTAPVVMSALHHLEMRLATGVWPPRPADFVAHRPPPMLRPCVRDGRCR
jgi:pimeloyl-ACP methyl ester carboxylesterase